MFQALIRTVTDRHSLPPSSLPRTPMGIPYGLLAEVQAIYNEKRLKIDEELYRVIDSNPIKLVSSELTTIDHVIDAQYKAINNAHLKSKLEGVKKFRATNDKQRDGKDE